MTSQVDEIPITFREPCYALFREGGGDTAGVLTTEYGNLAVFSVRSMADIYCQQARHAMPMFKIRVIEVHVSCKEFGVVA